MSALTSASSRPEKRCGKTTLLTVLSELVNRPVIAANISPPALFRVIEQTRPTLLIDEADTFLSAKDELRGILNSGYTRKTAYVLRVFRGPASCRLGPSPIVRFSCWCPKVLAAIGRLPETLADRCIMLRMQRKTPGEQCERLRNLDANHLRRRCARFVLDHRADIASVHPTLPAGLNDRAADIWEPLLALADLAGGAWPEHARQAALALTTTATENSPQAALFLDLSLLFASAHSDRLFSRTVIEVLNHLEDRPWTEANRGRPITELWLAQQLRSYGVQPRTLRLGDVQAKGYLAEDLKPVFTRYLPRADVGTLPAQAG